MPSRLRIGALSKQTGVSQDVLRVWERRYALLRPERTAGGFRVYSEEDAARVREMQRLLAAGVRAGDAARQVLEDGAGAVDGSLPLLQHARDHLWAALLSSDDNELQRAMDDLIARFDLDTAISEVLLPALQAIGRAWKEGEVSVGQEHLAVNVIRGRLLALARGWDGGFGPRVLLACPTGELHDVSLVMFGLAMRRRGWRVTFLGANTPGFTVEGMAELVRPELTVLYSADWTEHELLEGDLAKVAGGWRLALAGPGNEEIASRIGAEGLEGGPVEAAERLTRERSREPGTGKAPS
jgi:DNA-binding transcriptional MerR regulator